MDKAVSEEPTKNWDKAYKVTTQEAIQRDSNIVGSHFKFKIIVEEGGKKRLKARLCPYGKQERMKELISYDDVEECF